MFKRKFAAYAAVGVIAGVGLCLAVEYATGTIGVSNSERGVTCSPSQPIAKNSVEVCIVPAGTSAPEDLVRSVLAALVGSGVGLLTFLLSQRTVERQRVHRAKTAVAVVMQELQANRGALNEANQPPPPGGTPPPVRVDDSIFRQVRVEVAERLPYPLITETFGVYAQIAPLTNLPDVRGADQAIREQLREHIQELEPKLAEYGGAAKAW